MVLRHLEEFNRIRRRRSYLPCPFTACGANGVTLLTPHPPLYLVGCRRGPPQVTLCQNNTVNGSDNHHRRVVGSVIVPVILFSLIESAIGQSRYEKKEKIDFQNSQIFFLYNFFTPA
jgi:hypothetical protein